ncbi:MAG: hypothetical protein R3D28_21700 [Geminicoccaceae bacterium]|nr:hypothetical protein [Geminicoccaceae bacterium]HRY25371.1 hypothetical protein [Geminicoccaceae bacterium]
MRGSTAMMAVLLSLGSAALAEDGRPATRPALVWAGVEHSRVDLAHVKGTEPLVGEHGFGALRDDWQPGQEVAWQHGAIGLGLREENGRIKGGPYLQAGDWRLDLRPVGSDNALDIDGVTLRLTTKFGD